MILIKYTGKGKIIHKEKSQSGKYWYRWSSKCPTFFVQEEDKNQFVGREGFEVVPR